MVSAGVMVTRGLLLLDVAVGTASCGAKATQQFGTPLTTAVLDTVVGPPDSAANVVVEQPQLARAGRLMYPNELLVACVQGDVVLEFFVKEDGQVDGGTVRVVRTPHVGFNLAAIDFIVSSLFHPATENGRPVRALIRMPVHFSVRKRPCR